jgi:hypothetical protein
MMTHNPSTLSLMKTSCIAHSNLALIKYWGNPDQIRMDVINRMEEMASPNWFCRLEPSRAMGDDDIIALAIDKPVGVEYAPASTHT